VEDRCEHEQPAASNASESDDDVPIARSLRTRKVVHNTELAQKFGVLAIGEAVCRDFGPDGIFYGTVNAYRREGTDDLYTVRYTDGDQEDLDLQEYNFAYALWLTEEGWNAEDEDVTEPGRGSTYQDEEGSEDEDDYCEPAPQKVKAAKKVRFHLSPTWQHIS
jgi:hypothetical protein